MIRTRIYCNIMDDIKY